MIVEIITFRLAAGADEVAFLEANERVQTEFIPNQPGFMRRTVARGPDGEWTAVVLWGSMSDSEASSALWDMLPVMRTFMSFIEPDSLVVKRYEDLGG